MRTPWRARATPSSTSGTSVTQTGQPGPMITFSFFGKRGPQSELGDGLFVAAADVHHGNFVAPDLLDQSDHLLGERAGQDGIAELDLADEIIGRAGRTHLTSPRRSSSPSTSAVIRSSPASLRRTS